MCAPSSPKGTSFGRATVQLTRLSRLRCREANTLGVRSAYSLASACCALTVVRQHRRKKYPWGALRWRLLVCSRNLTCHCEPVRTLTSENCKHFCNHQTARFAKRWLFHKCQPLIRSTCSTERQGNKRSAAADLIASIAFRRTGGRTHVSPPNPRIKARIQRAASEPFGVSFFDIFLHAKKDIAPGGTSGWMPYQSRLKRNS